MNALEPSFLVVISMSNEPLPKLTRKKCLLVYKISEEDPTFGLSTNEETGQTIISGMGELLDIIRDRLFRI